MDLVRVPKKEKLYDKEEILGRDASSVFPTQAAEPDKGQATRDLLGASTRFVSESQLAELRAQRGDAAEEDAAPLKPLTQVLAEAKQAHEDKFQAVWKSMKTGKNRPLDEDELDFVNELKSREQSRDTKQAAEEQEQLDAFRQALQSARESKAQPSNPPAPILGPQGPPPKPSPKPQPSKPRITAKPVFRAKPVAPAAAGNSVADTAGNASDTPSAQDHQGLQALSAQRPEEGSQPPAKRAKAEAQAAAEQAGSDADEGQGFALLGGYASSDDAD